MGDPGSSPAQDIASLASIITEFKRPYARAKGGDLMSGSDIVVDHHKFAYI